VNVTLFDAISVLYLLRSVQVGGRLLKSWRSFWDDDVTEAEHRLAGEMAFFLLIPIGVLLHEAGHALATWQVGGTVIDFQWRAFWGYIIPQGNFTPLEDWWIALSGNLVSIGLALGAAALLPLVRRPAWGEVLYAFARVQALYALVWYPAAALLGFGDWATIYNFSATPAAYGMAAAHAGLLLGLWRLDRSARAARYRLRRRPAVLAEWQRLEPEAASGGLSGGGAPSASNLARAALLLFGNGEPALAGQYLERAGRLDPDEPQYLVARASIAFGQRRFYDAQRAAEAALRGSLGAEERAHLHALLARAFMNGGQRAQAREHFDAALRHWPENDDLYFWRGVMHRSLQRRDEARADFERALRFARNEAARGRAQHELESLS
jgi:tetratricopeptide (TPR) repeat protein